MYRMHADISSKDVITIESIFTCLSDDVTVHMHMHL